jgi:CRP-like cAMP-binding protein
MAKESMQQRKMSRHWHLSFPLLQNITSAQGKQVLGQASLSSWAAGTQVIGQMDAAGDVHFIISGSCRAVYYSEDGVAIAFRSIPAGSYFGELGILTDRPRVSSVIAESDLSTAKLSKADFLGLLLIEPKVGIAVARDLAKAVQQLTSRVVELTTLNVKERIWAELLRMSKEGSPVSHELAKIPMITHEKLAAIVGVNRETVTRELRSMRQLGLIDYSRQFLTIKVAPSKSGREHLSNLFDLTEVVT